MPRLNRRSREKAARELAEIFDSKLFKALCEPVRVEIVKFLTAEGRSDVRTIAAHFPQHASVVSRHLALLHQAGVVRRQKEGRHVFFEVDGPEMVERMEKILGRFRNILPLCCPPGGK
jgi:DNA-binding transcriptional ArsR family regulator